MKNFRTLVRFELKKILGKKLTWIAFGLVFLAMLMTDFYALIVSQELDGVHMTVYEAELQEKEKLKQIAGQMVDDELLTSMFDALATSETAFEPYAKLYFGLARPLGEGAAISRGTVEGAKEELGIAEDEELIYTARKMKIESIMEERGLKEAEKEYWREILATEETIPWIYDYYTGPEAAWTAAYTVIVLLAIMLAVCLANLFADEHQRKTDQLVLCSRNGRKVLYLAKITAGALFTLVSTGLVLLVTVIPPLILYGTDGLHAPIQLEAPTSMLQMTFGEAIVYTYILVVIASMLYTSIILCCSEVFRNSAVAVVAVVVALVLIPTIITIPYEFRVLSQIFDLNPVNAVAIWSVLDCRLVPVPGGYLTMQQATPLVYALLIGVFVVIGRQAYLKYQVEGR